MGEKAHFSDRKMKNDFAVLTINLKTNHAAQGVRESGGMREGGGISRYSHVFLDKNSYHSARNGMQSGCNNGAAFVA